MFNISKHNIETYIFVGLGLTEKESCIKTKLQSDRMFSIANGHHTRADGLGKLEFGGMTC